VTANRKITVHIRKFVVANNSFHYFSRLQFILRECQAFSLVILYDRVICHAVNKYSRHEVIVSDFLNQIIAGNLGRGRVS
jgi:hypothetical protein